MVRPLTNSTLQDLILQVCTPDHEAAVSNFIYSCIHFIQLSGNSYQLLESECI